MHTRINKNFTAVFATQSSPPYVGVKLRSVGKGDYILNYSTLKIDWLETLLYSCVVLLFYD